MYEKNLTEDLRLRLTERDMNFLRGLAEERATSISEVIRSIIGEYRRALENVATLKKALDAIERENNGGLSNGDIKTTINDKL